MTDGEVTVDAALRQQVVKTLTDLLVRMLRLGHPVTEETNLADELRLSSSQAAQLVLDLEQDLSIMIDVEDLDVDTMVTVGDLADYITGHSTPQ